MSTTATAAATADKDKANPPPTVDLSTLPTSALTSYVEYYSLAPNYPPARPARARSSTPSDFYDEEDEAEDDDAAAGEEGADDETGQGEGAEDQRTEEEILAEASGKRRAALASAAATSTSYSGKASDRFRARSPPATTTPGGPSAGKKRSHADAEDGEDVPREREGEPCPDDFFDEEDAKSYLAGLAQKHFAAQQAPKEGEVVVGFLYRCRTKDKCLKIA
ncbi:hypothetical protein BDZ90DRAFT_232426 [Jaminaea rosea]|uniref:Histone deacetylase complex subunit SAP30 Sin3 binding domain-containing protein n=1 Tax=Jaminaea rosea TaxID=1569628 RepID=A0A316UQ84_9BASI|nr:hypothetical protein BDZ90DRAFT_232426 [Jaminaea rosea]PWN27456.1 hypothetical protein BDZ90DRAFT_232426 [Jaminaea rosea]